MSRGNPQSAHYGIKMRGTAILPAAALFCAMFFTAMPLCAAQPHANLPANPNDLLRQAIGREVKGLSADGYYMWLERYRSHHGLVTKRYITTPEGILGRIVAYDDKPLTPEARTAEEARIERLKDPAQMADKGRKQQQERDRWNSLMRALPDAFLCHYAGEEMEPNGHPVAALDVEPNPKWQPSTLEQHVLTGMKGLIRVDLEAMRVLSIDATSFREVGLGWGPLGHILPGGVVHIEQSEVAHGHWDSTYLKLRIHLRVLYMKTIPLEEEGVEWDYRPVPRLSVAEALDLLRKTDGNSAPQLPAGHRF